MEGIREGLSTCVIKEEKVNMDVKNVTLSLVNWIETISIYFINGILFPECCHIRKETNKIVKKIKILK